MPLSPYLAVLVMTCIEEDIRGKLSENVTTNRIKGLNFDMVFYADDTIVSSTEKNI